MPLNTSQLWAPVEPVVRKFFGLGSKSIKKIYPQLFDVSKGKEPVRHAVQMGGPGQLVKKTEGGNVTALTIKQGTNKTWLYDLYAGRVELTFELARDNKVREIKKAAQTLGRSVALTPEYQAGLFFDRAYNSAYSQFADGTNELCATDHIIIGTSASTGSNMLATAAALSETSLQDVYTNLLSMPGPDGMITACMPEKLLVPAALALTGKKLTIAGKTLGSANNDPKVVGDDLTLVVNPYLTDTNNWFVITDYMNGLWWEWDIESDFMEDNVMTNLNKAFIAISRFRFGADDWRGVYGGGAVA